MALAGSSQLQRPARPGAAQRSAPARCRAPRPAALPSRHQHGPGGRPAPPAATAHQPQLQQAAGLRIRLGSPTASTSLDEEGAVGSPAYSYSNYSSYEEGSLDLGGSAEHCLEWEAARLEALLANLRGCGSLQQKVRRTAAPA
jgi:hypothetical protein